MCNYLLSLKYYSNTNISVNYDIIDIGKLIETMSN